MTKILLKQNITKQISKIDDENFLKAVYTIVSNKADQSFELDDKMKKELDTRKENHRKGSKSYTWQQVKKDALMRNA
jgi:flagellar motor component MotA